MQIDKSFCFNKIFISVIITIYLKTQLGYSEDASTMMFHTFNCAVFMLTLFGGFVADKYLGKFK